MEIEFRGKRKCKLEALNDKWITGGYAVRNNIHYIFPATERYGLSIDPATVGQYTGLLDKNGVKIFEGDIVLETLDDVGDQTLEVFFSDGCFCTHGYLQENICLQDTAPYCEIIGNIHDNPELLEVQA